MSKTCFCTVSFQPHGTIRIETTSEMWKTPKNGGFRRSSILKFDLVNRYWLNIKNIFVDRSETYFWSSYFFESYAYLQNWKKYSEVQTPPKNRPVFLGGLVDKSLRISGMSRTGRVKRRQIGLKFLFFITKQILLHNFALPDFISNDFIFQA